MPKSLFNAFAFVFLGAWSSIFGQTILSNLDSEINEIVEKIRPSVVTVSAIIPNKLHDESFFSFLNETDSEHPQQRETFITNIGTGIVLHELGYAVTKSSVVAGAEHIYIQFSSDTTYLAELIGLDSEHSIALLRFEAPNLIPLKLGNPRLLRAGSWTVLVGNSLGISSAVGLGNINAVYENGLLQIAVNTSPGNNGSPVMNSNGEVIGMVSGRLTISSGQQNGVASGTECALVTPIDHVLKACKNIMTEFVGTHGWLGITVQPYEEKLPQVVAVLPGSPAEKTGLVVGDVVTKINEIELQDYYDLKKIMNSVKPEQYLRVQIKRNGQPQEFQLKASRMPDIPLFSEMSEALVKNSKEEHTMKFDFNNNREQKQFERRLLMMEKKIQSLQNQLKNRK
ncbi:MAG: PDZ domain-containing protein [Calditrichaeota bacterium]|nr:MAG: PDZ domain-containing protein [Calditrichota bacterium]